MREEFEEEVGGMMTLLLKYGKDGKEGEAKSQSRLFRENNEDL